MIYSWGNSNSGQLGMGNTETNPHPRALHLAVSSGTKMKGIACGTRHSFVWTQQGDCFSFGNNYSAQLGYDFRKPDYKENQVCLLIFFSCTAIFWIKLNFSKLYFCNDTLSWLMTLKWSIKTIFMYKNIETVARMKHS